MDNVCNLCSQPVTELYQVPGYTFLTCSKCSENVTKGIMPNFYQNSRPTMVPTTSSILTSQLTSAAVSAVLNEHQQMHQKKSTIAIANNQLASFEQALQSMEGEILVGEEGQCPVCQKIFNRKTSLLNHIRNHSADKKYVCNYCQKGFSQQANLRNHERIHTNDRPYVCVDCGKAFTQITNLNNHRRLHTGERPYVCIELNCGRSFAQVTNLNNHMKTHHKIQQYVCNQCPKRFTTVTQLNHHLATHSDERGYVCPQCPDKSFKQQSHLQQHMKIHGSNFGFSCPQPNCREKFVQATHLETHLKSHGDFGCSMCTSNFSDENLLKKHIQKHLDGRYLSCPAEGCNDGFTLKHQLTKHLQIHHPIEYQKHKESKQVPLSLLAITPNIDTKQKIKVEQIEQIQPIMEPTTFTQIPITIHNGTVAITIPATYQQQLATVQTITPDGIITNAIAPSTSDATKKVLSMSQLINNVAVASVSNEELERLNNINTFLNTFTVNSQNQIVAEVVSAAHVINQDRKVCQFCYNVFKTAQTLNRHIEKFHS